jgi:hypothetical protein
MHACMHVDTKIFTHRKKQCFDSVAFAVGFTHLMSPEVQNLVWVKRSVERNEEQMSRCLSVSPKQDRAYTDVCVYVFRIWSRFIHANTHKHIHRNQVPRDTFELALLAVPSYNTHKHTDASIHTLTTYRVTASN